MLDAVCVNYRTSDDLEQFLVSWENANIQVPHNLIVVNVDPEDADVEVADQFHWIEDHMIYSDNVGYARACNDASTYGTGEVLAFFNADVRIIAGTLEACYESLLQHPDWGVLGPRQIDDRMRITHGGILGTNDAPVQRGWMERDRGQFNEVRDDAVSVMGSAYFVKRDVWELCTYCDIFQEMFPGENGAFGPTPLYYEETLCSYHVREHGYKCAYMGSHLLVHRWHKSVNKNGDSGKFDISRKIFREFCDLHNIEHDQRNHGWMEA